MGGRQGAQVYVVVHGGNKFLCKPSTLTQHVFFFFISQCSRDKQNPQSLYSTCTVYPVVSQKNGNESVRRLSRRHAAVGPRRPGGQGPVRVCADRGNQLRDDSWAVGTDLGGQDGRVLLWNPVRHSAGKHGCKSIRILIDLQPCPPPKYTIFLCVSM